MQRTSHARPGHVAVVSLLTLIGSAPALAAGLSQPSVSPASDRYVDTAMPPLTTVPANPQVLSPDAAPQSSVLAAFASRAFPQVTTEFAQFLHSQAAVDYGMLGKQAKVRDRAAFAQMQRYLFNRTNGMTVLGSLHQQGAVFDCIPQAQQPGLRDGRAIAAPPPVPTMRGGAATAERNAQHCAAGSVPLRRISIAELASYPDLQTFLHARQRAPLAPDAVAKPAADGGHFHSLVYFGIADPSVNGAGTDINVWAPKLRNANQTQSISQLWIVGNSTQGLTQTLEAGWEVQPAIGLGPDPVVFIYSTQDGYASTGCHNLSCGDFVQVSSSNVLGVAPAGGYSVPGGKQTMLHVEFLRNTDGNWWLGVNSEWIGYYKSALYSGDLANGKVQYVSAGGETSTDDGTPSTMMGSGKFATAGYRQAAFQANLFYRDAGRTPTFLQQLSSANVVQPTCYSLAISGYAYDGKVAGVTRAASPAPEMGNGGFYFGGPGCQ